MADPKNTPTNSIARDIEAQADYYPPSTYGLGAGTSGENGGLTSILSYYSNLTLEADSATEQFIPISSVPQRSRNTKVFAVGILPPVQNVTGRLLDRTASLPVRDLTGVDTNTLFALSEDAGAAGVNTGTETTEDRQGVLDIAARELGQGDWTKYTDIVDPAPPQEKISWCGVFATWCLNQSGYDARWTLGKGIQPPLPTTRDPQPGDLIYLGGPLHHYGIVESVEGDQVKTIDGNSQGRRVARNTRKKSEVVAFFSTANLRKTSSSWRTQGFPGSQTYPVGYDSNSTASWQSKGSANAKSAAKEQQALANTDIKSLSKSLLEAQSAAITATRQALGAMANSPPLRLLVNPNKFSVKAQKIASDGSWSRRGPIIEFWGDDQDKISGSGQVAAFYAIDTVPPNPRGAGPGLTRTARNASQAYQNFQSLWLLYRNNGVLHMPDGLTQADRDVVLSTVGGVYIYYDNILYIGSFDSFNVTEEDTKPFTLSYDFEFTVRAAFLLELGEDYNYNTQQPDHKLSRTNVPRLPTKSNRLASSPAMSNDQVLADRDALLSATTADEAAVAGNNLVNSIGEAN